MRSFEERKNEVLLRSKNAMTERKRSKIQAFTLLTVVILSLTTLNILPSKDEPKTDGAGCLDDIAGEKHYGSTGSIVEGIPGYDISNDGSFPDSIPQVSTENEEEITT
jgi:hypothetical protein